MEYNSSAVEKKWKQYWIDQEIYKVSNDSNRPKYYVLDMFPYPSGSGLHVGHPLGYIASDIFARFKRLKGFNVLHPMGFDAFGLPAEEYALATGIHPEDSTLNNMERFRQQLGNLGFSFDWSREVYTSNPKYYKWTQWIFTQLFEHYYDKAANKAMPIEDLKTVFAKAGNATVKAATTQVDSFSAEDWKSMSVEAQEEVLMNYRLAYQKTGYVNWCEALGTVLANDQVKDGRSDRGNHPVTQKPMKQWYLRITAYAQRMLDDLEHIEWSEALKAMQTNWIGRSEGASIFFDIADSDEQIEVFTTRPDTIFGATYMVLAPENDLVAKLTTAGQRAKVDAYLDYVNSRSEVERQAEKKVTGEFIGAYAINPFTNTKIPIWIGEYVLKDYGTGAIMAVPSDDERDKTFATKFGLEIIEVVDKSDYPGATLHDKLGKIINSDFLNGMEVPEAIQEMFKQIEARGIGQKEINFRLRDSNFSRQRYWGEPFPLIYDEKGIPHAVELDNLPVELPRTEDFKPGKGGRSPLARMTDWVDLGNGFTRETDTMPAVAGSSWYFLRYMDPDNDDFLVGEDAVNYWQDVDLYVGGAEHAVAHLMYARFWHKFLFDKGIVPTNEPFKKLINQGMIQGVITKLYLAYFVPAQDWSLDLKSEQFDATTTPTVWVNADTENGQIFQHPELGEGHLLVDYKSDAMQRMTPFPFVKENATATSLEYRLYKNDYEGLDFENDPNAAYLRSIFTNLAKAADWRMDEEGKAYLLLGDEIGKMSKSKYNVINPDDIISHYGADCLRMYEMFLGPIEQAKPWDTKGIDGVYKFLRRFWDMFFDKNDNFVVNDKPAGKKEMKVLHTAIKKVNDDIERFSFNTCVSAFMVATNDLRKLKCNNREVLQPLVVLLAPFAPFFAEELWHRLGMEDDGSVHQQKYPIHDERFLKEDSITYPISINGKKRALVDFPSDASKQEIEAAALELEEIQKWIEGKTIRKIIVVPKRMVNIVVG